MISRSTIGASLIVLLVQLMSEHLNSGLALSISSSNKNGLSNSGNTNGRNNYNQASGASSGANQQHQTLTTMPPLMTTISHINYLDSLSQQAYQTKQQDNHSSEQTRSNSEDHDDSIPLATINNHSRNSQQLSRPPQYVDVAALVGRERNSTSSQATSSLGASSLAAKSRSGLPECATQQVCNAIFVRMNYTQKLCECSSNYNWKCSNNLDPQDGHTIELTRKFDKRIYTQIKTCEPLKEVRACKSPTDWTLLALQSERSGKAHYVVVCKCPTWAQLEGPYTHNHPPYANIPGIRVYGMLCAHQTARSSAQSYATYNPALSIYPEFPWAEALSVLNTTSLISTLDSH